MKKRTKLISLALCASILVSGLFTGCGKKDGRTTITVGNWPLETATTYKSFQDYKARFEEKYPDIDLKTDTGDNSFKTFMAKGMAGQLPGISSLPFTEIDKVSESGFALELTAELDKRGYLSAMNSQLREVLSTDDGEIYCIPFNTYRLGLCINKKLFTQAGLINEDGTVKYPKTYDELIEFASIIKEKTGKAGYAMATMNNQGGWLFMPMAWSCGVEFMTETNGEWRATFNSPEMEKAFQYVYDMKWKYGILPENTLMQLSECEKLFAADELAMYIAIPPEQALAKTYGMNPNDIVWAPLPAGDKGQYTLLGGAFFYINGDYDEEQVDAVFNWLNLRGQTPEYDEETLATLEKSYQTRQVDGQIIEPIAISEVWTNKEREEKEQEIRAKYTNVDVKNFEAYSTDTKTVLRAEEPVCCQELYSVLDTGIQEILTNKNVDIDALIKNLNDNFQKDYLDEQEEN